MIKYYRFVITRPKERVVDAMIFSGRIVQHVLCDEILEPYFTKRLIKENAACQRKKGTHFGMQLLEKYMRAFSKRYYDTGYIVNIDFRQYFPSINRVVLKDLLKDFPDKEVLEFIYFIINSVPQDVGIPIGNQASQWFAVYYLDQVDRIIKEQYRIKWYVRYMDDLVILVPTKEQAKEIFDNLQKIVMEKLSLTFNPKSQYFPFKRGVSFLGWKFIPTRTDKVIKKVAHSKIHDKNSKIKENKKRLDKGEISQEQYLRNRQCMINNLKYGDTYYFRKNHNLL